MAKYLEWDKATTYAAFFAVFLVNILVVIYIVSVVRDPQNFNKPKKDKDDIFKND